MTPITVSSSSSVKPARPAAARRDLKAITGEGRFIGGRSW
jgi:hypothetical protein